MNKQNKIFTNEERRYLRARKIRNIIRNVTLLALITLLVLVISQAFAYNNLKMNYDSMIDKNKHLSEEVKNCKSEIETLNKQIKQLNQDNTLINQTIVGKDQYIQQLENSIKELEVALITLENKIQKINENNIGLTKKSGK